MLYLSWLSQPQQPAWHSRIGIRLLVGGGLQPAWRRRWIWRERVEKDAATEVGEVGSACQIVIVMPGVEDRRLPVGRAGWPGVHKIGGVVRNVATLSPIPVSAALWPFLA